MDSLVIVEICSCQYCTFKRVFDAKHKLNFAWQGSKAKGVGDREKQRDIPVCVFFPPLPSPPIFLPAHRLG